MAKIKTTFDETKMINAIWGGTLMGGGGGGSISSGIDLLNAFKRDHPTADVTVDLIDYDQMGSNEYAAATAGMGAPAAIVGVDFSKWAQNAYNLLKDIAKSSGKELKYNIPVELGGFSIFFPFLLSLVAKADGVKDAYTVDADGAGRAVPALDTLLLHVNGCPTAPIALANGDNDRITVDLVDPHNASLAEQIGRNISGQFGNMVGISGWLVNGEDIEKRIITNSITLCEQIGEVMRSSKYADDSLFEALNDLGLITCKAVCKGKITSIKVETHGGFDYGTLDVVDEATGVEYRINFQNENLLLQKKNADGTYADMMTVPDLTCMYCIDPNGAEGVLPRMPLSNADAKEGMKVAVGIAKVDPKWFITEGTWWNVWATCMKNIGYEGGHLSYDNVVIG